MHSNEDPKQPREKKKKKKTLPFSAQGVGSIPGQRTKVSHTSQLKNENLKQKHYCKKFSKDFKNGPHQKKNLTKKNKDPPKYGYLSRLF